MSRLTAIENLYRSVPFEVQLKTINNSNTAYGSTAVNLYMQKLSGGRYLIPEILKIEIDFPPVGLSNMPDIVAEAPAEESWLVKHLYEAVNFRAGRGSTQPDNSFNSDRNAHDSAGAIAAFIRHCGIGIYRVADANSDAVFEMPRGDSHQERDLVIAGRGKLVPSGVVTIDAARYSMLNADNWACGSSDLTDPAGLRVTNIYGPYARGVIHYRFAVLNLFQMQYLLAKFSTQASYDESTKFNEDDVALAYVVPNPAGTKWNDPV